MSVSSNKNWNSVEKRKQVDVRINDRLIMILIASLLLIVGGYQAVQSEAEAIKAWNTRRLSNPLLPQHPFDFTQSASAVDFRGNLKSLGLSTILQILSSENKTGVLHFTHDKAVRAICFKNGKMMI